MSLITDPTSTALHAALSGLAQRQRDVAARMSYGPARPVASYIDRVL